MSKRRIPGPLVMELKLCKYCNSVYMFTEIDATMEATRRCSWLRHYATSMEVARSKASACDLSLSGIASSDPAGGTDVYIVCGAVKTEQHARRIREKKKGTAKEQD